MARRVVWSREAKQDLADIYHFSKLDNPEAAKAVANKIRELTKILSDHPWIGRIVPEHGREDIRERIYRRYRIFYQVSGDDKVRILHVFHSAQDELPDL